MQCFCFSGCFNVAGFRFGENKSGNEIRQFLLLFDTAFEKTNLFFTFSAEKKAKKALENAEERLAEAEESASENKPEAVSEAMENYQENISLAEMEAKAIKRRNKNESPAFNNRQQYFQTSRNFDGSFSQSSGTSQRGHPKAIEASKKGQEEAMKEIIGARKRSFEIKQEIKQEKERKKRNK